MNDYPNLWKRKLIQKRVRERAQHRCEHCGIEFHEGTNIAICHYRADGKPVIGTVHHIDGNPANCSMRNLVYLCQKCHMFVQYRWWPGEVLPLRWRNQVPRWIMTRKLRYRLHPQLVLMDADRKDQTCK